MPNDRCEVVLYSPEHSITFGSLGIAGARKVIDLWAERTTALGARGDIQYVLVFENRGADAGATIDHPHGQIYAFDLVPELPRNELQRGGPLPQGERGLVASVAGWSAWVPLAPIFPYAVRIAPQEAVPDLPSLDDGGRNGLADILIQVLGAFDRLFARPTPYTLWIHQRPFDGGAWPGARMHVEIVSPWRNDGVMRYIAAGELGSGIFFNPVAPEAAAEALRTALMLPSNG